LSTPITWSGSSSVSGATSVNSDSVGTNELGFSYVVKVTGTGSGGISGSLYVLVSNDGVTYAPLAGSIISVNVADGVSQTFGFSSSTAFSDVELAWIAGSDTAGTLSSGAWSIVPQPSVSPVPVPAIAVLPGVLASLQQALSNSYGVDVLCVTDIDPYLSLTQNALPQDAYHLLTEQPGSIFWAPVTVFSLLTLLSKGVSSASTDQVESMIQAVVSSDERVAQCQVSVEFDGEETLIARIVVAPQQGQTFQYVVGISKVSITLISVNLVSR
jgi:hypothetical protein